MFSIYINDENCKIPIDEDIYYIVGQNGIFLKKTIDLIDCIVPVNNISMLKKVDACVKMNIPKIPQEVFSKIVSFFYYVHMMYKSEAAVVLFYDKKTASFEVQVPLQKISSGSVEYESLPNYDNYQKIGTIHSHSSMSAFHSTTDVKDEETFDGIHITVGQLNGFEKEKQVDIVCSIVVNGLRTMVEPMDYINGISEITVEHIPLESKYSQYWKIDDKSKNTKLYSVKPIYFDESWLEKLNIAVTTSSIFAKYGSNFSQHFKFDNDYKNHPCIKCPFLEYKLLLQDDFEDVEFEEVDSTKIEYEIHPLDFSLFDEEKFV
jgi:PRTRC genetic system protein A